MVSRGVHGSSPVRELHENAWEALPQALGISIIGVDLIDSLGTVSGDSDHATAQEGGPRQITDFVKA
jgi:hypothetical protein